MKTTLLAAAIAGIIGAGAVYAQTDYDRPLPCDGGDCYHMKHHKSTCRDFGDDHKDFAMQRMMKELDLTDEQREELKAYRDEMRETGKARRDELRKARREIRNLDPEDKDYLQKLEKLAARKGELSAKATVERGKMRARFHSILTDEQRQQLLKKRDEMRQQRLERIKERRQELQELEDEMAE